MSKTSAIEWIGLRQSASCSKFSRTRCTCTSCCHTHTYTTPVVSSGRCCRSLYHACICRFESYQRLAHSSVCSLVCAVFVSKTISALNVPPRTSEHATISYSIHEKLFSFFYLGSFLCSSFLLIPYFRPSPTHRRKSKQLHAAEAAQHRTLNTHTHTCTSSLSVLVCSSFVRFSVHFQLCMPKEKPI